jgi:hypothetical protein
MAFKSFGLTKMPLYVISHGSKRHCPYEEGNLCQIWVKLRNPFLQFHNTGSVYLAAVGACWLTQPADLQQNLIKQNCMCNLNPPPPFRWDLDHQHVLLFCNIFLQRKRYIRNYVKKENCSVWSSVKFMWIHFNSSVCLITYNMQSSSLNMVIHLNNNYSCV